MRANDLLGRTALTVAIGCIALVAVTVGVLATPAVRSRLGLAPARTVSYAVGGRIDVPASVYEGSDYTVVLFARSSCTACQRSQPLFAKVAAAVAADPGIRFAMMTTAANRPGDVPYAKAIGLDEGQLVTLDAAPLRLKIVPTLVLVDRQGQVHYAHEGAPSAAHIDELLRTAATLSRRH